MNPYLGRRLRYGMVGGGPGAFIGAVHRHAAALDGEFELVAGAFSSDPQRSAEQGELLGLHPKRVYESYEAMAEAEASMGEEARIDAVVIVTPNHLHYPVARVFLESGFDVICDKPMTTSIADANRLSELVAKTGRVFALTHNYTGYPMVKEARELVRSGRLGTLRKVVAEYSQGWLSTLLESTGHKQAEWRTDPERAGVSSALGDIGSHAENLVGYVTGLETESIFCDMASLVPGRVLEDDANLLLRFRGGARGVLYASQVSVGEENGLRIRAYGSDAGLEWCQERPDELWLLSPDHPKQRLTRGSAYLSEAAHAATRLPPGHPEGFLEAFANIYKSAGRAMGARRLGRDPVAADGDFPGVLDGARGIRFIHAAVESSRRERWVSLTPGSDLDPAGSPRASVTKDLSP